MTNNQRFLRSHGEQHGLTRSRNLNYYFLYIILVATAVFLYSNFTIQYNLQSYGDNDEEESLFHLSFVSDVSSSSSSSSTSKPSSKTSSLSKTTMTTTSKNDIDIKEVRSDNDNEKYISYKLKQHHGFNNTFDIFYKCDLRERKVTSRAFTNAFDFQVEIDTSYNILYMGDSVALQFAQGLQEATGATYKNRKVLRYSWREHEGLHIAAPVRGGGAVAGWRISGMLKADQRNNDYQMPPTPGGGWMEIDWRNIRRSLAIMSPFSSSVEIESQRNDHLHSSQLRCEKAMETKRKIEFVGMKLPLNTMEDELRGCPEADFDVAIFQIPFGWLPKPSLNSISYEIIDETIQQLHYMFGAKIIIIQNVPVGNNLQNFHSEMIPINNIVKNYTDAFKYDLGGKGNATKDGIKAVLNMDMASFSISLFQENAASLGLIDSNIENSTTLINQLNGLLQNRTECCHYAFPQIIGFTCAQVVANMTKKCTRTIYSNDGHHWCQNKIGGRSNGVVACLIKCGHDYPSMKTELKLCEKQCNQKYMSLDKIAFPYYDGVLEDY